MVAAPSHLQHYLSRDRGLAAVRGPDLACGLVVAPIASNANGKGQRKPIHMPVFAQIASSSSFGRSWSPCNLPKYSRSGSAHRQPSPVQQGQPGMSMAD